MTLLSSLCLCLMTHAAIVFSQTKPDDFVLSISVDKPVFVTSQNIKVRARLENRTKRSINSGVTFFLSKRGRDLGKCTITDCFTASVSFGKEIRGSEPFEFEVDLTDLYWNELISSNVDMSAPKNMLTKVTSGEYSFFMSFFSPDGNSTKEVPRNIEFDSNVISVKVEGKR